MSKSLVSDKTKRRILAMLNARDTTDGIGHIGGKGRPWCLVRCDSNIPVGSSGNILDQCYPATIILASSAFTYPPESTFDPAMSGSPVLLTVLDEDGGDSPVAVVPSVGLLYFGPLCGPVESDAAGSKMGRGRVISPNIYRGGMIDGTGTQNHVTRWEDADTVKDSFTQISDTGVASFYNILSPGATNALIRLDPDDTNSRATIGLYPNGTAGQRALIRVEDNVFELDLDVVAGARTLRVTDSGFSSLVAIWDFHTTGDVSILRASGLELAGGSECTIGSPLAGELLVTVEPNFGIAKFRLDPGDVTAEGQYQVVQLGVTYNGTTGTVGAMTVKGGLVTSLPSAAGDALLSGTQTFTAANTFAPTANVIPIVARGSVGATVDTFLVEDSGGTDLFKVTASGVVTAPDASGLAGLNASNLASGTIPGARIGDVDGGTW